MKLHLPSSFVAFILRHRQRMTPYPKKKKKTMAGGLSESEITKLRNRFKKDAEFLLQPVSDEEEKCKCCEIP